MTVIELRDTMDAPTQPRTLTPDEMPARKCIGCGAVIVSEFNDYPDLACADCRYRYPPSLLKAQCDPFDYALRLRTGEIIQFETASIHGEYVTLTLHDYHDNFPGEFKFPCPRGLDVRVSAIVWCVDAPRGS